MDLQPSSYTLVSPYFCDTIHLLPLRRSHSRYPVQKIAYYHYEGKNFLTLTLDLGQGGMKIKTHQYLSEDEHLNFKLVLGKKSIWLKGRIVYSQFLPDKHSVSGIEFIEVSKRDRNLLEDYLGTLDESLKQEVTPFIGKK